MIERVVVRVISREERCGQNMQYDLNARDLKTIRAMVNANVPTEHLEEFYETIRHNGPDLNSSTNSSAFKLQVIKYAAVIFNSTKTWADAPSNLNETILPTAFLLEHCENDERMYKSLSPRAQQYFMSRPETDQSPARAHTYLRTLNALGASPLHTISETMSASNRRASWFPSLENRIRLILDELKEDSENALAVNNLDCAFPSALLIKYMTSRTVKNVLALESSALEMMLLWKVLFTEEVMLEFIERFKDCDMRVGHERAMSILENWDTVRTYPAEWILSLHP